MQPGAVHHDEGGARPGGDRLLVDGEQRPPVVVAEATAGRHRRRTFPDGAAEPECVEGPDAVRHEPDARTGLPQLGTPLEHGHRMPGPVQGRRRGEPAQSGADHHDVHVHPLSSTSVEASVAPHPLQK